MNKFLKILTISFISIIFILVVLFFSVITYQKHKSEEVIDHVIERKGWDEKIKHTKMSYNIAMGYAEKDIIFKDQPHSVYEYHITPSPAPWTNNKEYKVTGETDLKKKESYYKYLLDEELYKK
ncbi:DUF3139 domain-containing protein [Staphylococcus pettenkoferi]|uniref:DUF3139 domain-containing protein n=1 Tax=Staphylococcus pettenkoferi TaxID=170573 RepID=A0A9Q4D830_9STAP|nr:DUF3139 domain-containing protein [Staphylococcus pettenkoferi]MCY1569656.1 DUF3139 domain-containing protein [Staphylococcus pettenkoferi]MCY1576076.1 DUF3139 domain-containing protein [Staphylococcus pettenkoferi]MCY1594171.1 DUF3139 domain-containing protein [Staphylococcus pettenkoferi]MCY1617655.1 DUF3139 domain-containing protein [Staphylococcus pettenkoferi]